MSQRPKASRAETSEMEMPPTTLSKKQFQQVKNLTKDDGHFNLVRNFNLADAITLCNGACGALSIFSNLRYLISYDQYYLQLAMWCIPLGFMFDVFDGRVARWRQTSSILGQELDSLADAAECALNSGYTAKKERPEYTTFQGTGRAWLLEGFARL
ncbi:CDP-diacylglycerol-serine O-phosphatidyltransferase [Podila clonocystis]|nr:CDP-diacylglycerol-serine O-phosphatidyltransferase [Podila clonocystis]